MFLKLNMVRFSCNLKGDAMQEEINVIFINKVIKFLCEKLNDNKIN